MAITAGRTGVGQVLTDAVWETAFTYGTHGKSPRGIFVRVTSGVANVRISPLHYTNDAGTTLAVDTIDASVASKSYIERFSMRGDTGTIWKIEMQGSGGAATVDWGVVLE